MVLILVYSLLLLAYVSNGARILSLIPMPAFSHQHFLHPIWRALSLRGHNVTVLTTEPINEPELTNLTHIDVRYAYKYMKQMYDNVQNLSMFNAIPLFNTMCNTISDAELSHPKIKQLIKDEEKFDLVIVESGFPELLAFGELSRCPTIIISTIEPPSLLHVAIGNPSHPALNPEYVLPFHGQLSFKERFISTVFQGLINYYRENVAYVRKQKIVTKHFGGSMPSVMDMLRKIDMVFIGVSAVLFDVRALGPTTVTFGGVHLRPLQPLPKVNNTSLQVFL